jgi:hypothetical protein
MGSGPNEPAIVVKGCTAPHIGRRRRLSTASRSPTPADSPPKLARRHAELHRAMTTARERHNSSRSRDHNLDFGIEMDN